MNFKQIAVSVDAEGNESLYALSKSGRLLVKKSAYTFVPDGRGNRREWRYWWEEVDLPIGDLGVIGTEPIPASTPGICVHCNTPTGDESVVCKDCEYPF